MSKGMVVKTWIRVALVCAALSACDVTPEAAGSHGPPASGKHISGERNNSAPPPKLILVNTTAYNGMFGTVFILEGTINNTGRIGYKNPIIGCDLFSDAPKPLARLKATLYQRVLAGQSVHFSELNMGLAPSSHKHFLCKVLEATPQGA